MDNILNAAHDEQNEYQHSADINEDLKALRPDITSDSVAGQNRKVNLRIDEAAKATAQKADQNLDLLLRNADEIDAKTKDLLIRNRTLVQALFPSKMDKLVHVMQTNTVQAAMDFRLNLYKLSVSFRLEALREKYNAALMTIRAMYREQVSDFMMNKLLELHQKVDQKQRSFIELAKSKYQYAAQQRDFPEIQTVYYNHITAEFNSFMIFLNRQVTSFESIIDEQIKNFS